MNLHSVYHVHSLHPPLLSLLQCAGVNGDNYQGAFSEPVIFIVEPPETQEGTFYAV